MTYLKKVIIENFQSHKYSEIEFDQGLNIIVGQSDSGKTSIIRAIRWALYNEPSGDYFIRQGETYCSVTLEFSNTITLKRYRGKSKNYYLLTDTKGEEVKYEGFGLDVPDEIIEVIGIGKVSLDSSDSNEINLSEQLEGPFLLSKKNSVKASAIGRLIGVNLIDDALKVGLTDLRNLKNRKNIFEDNLIYLKNESKNYEYLDDLNIELTKLISIKNNIKFLEEKLNKLKNISNNLRSIQKEKYNTEYIICKTKGVNKLDYKLIILESIIFKHKDLYNKNKSIIKIKKSYIENKNILKSVENTDNVDKIFIDLNNMEKNLTKYKGLNQKLKKIKRANTIEANILNKLKSIDEAEGKIFILEKKNTQLFTVKDYYDKKIQLRDRLKKGKLYLDKLNRIEGLEKIYDDLDCVLNKHKKLKSLSKNIKAVKKIYIYEKSILNNSKLQMRSYKSDLKTILEKIEVCPLCYSDIDEEKINKIINNT